MRPFLACFVGLCLPTGCSDDPSIPVEDDAGTTAPKREFGEPCERTEDCSSGLCLQIESGRAICSKSCTVDDECPQSVNWGCVRPERVGISVCACVLQEDEEICGDGIDNECNGEVDNCRLCDGRPVADDDREHCGECGNACGEDLDCIGDSCQCRDADRRDCDGSCVLVESDTSHCGACNRVCFPGQSCVDGTCQCPDGEELCDGSCRELASDTSNCGECGAVCLDDQSCVSGECRCPEGGEVCEGHCVDTTTSPEHCGACGGSCDPAQSCQSGECQCTPSHFSLCSGQCVDTGSDADHCGECDSRCLLPGSTCRNGACVCESTSASPCMDGCQELSRDTGNCGGCGITCREGETCHDGSCACISGVYCGDVCMPQNDSQNCGTCGYQCGATQRCVAGYCSCNAVGFDVCGADCRRLDIDPTSCGTCDRSCRPSEVCIGGSCQCPSGLSWCESAGLCIDTSSHEAHCGGCDSPCASEILSCISGQCRCPGFGQSYCAAVDECVSLSTDEAHCGDCDTTCRPTELCQSGRCTCSSGRTYCDSATACIDTRVSEEHCGACDTQCPTGASRISSTCTCDDGALTPCDTGCTNIEDDEDNCGACGVTCGATQTCIGGRCLCPAPVDGWVTPIADVGGVRAAGITISDTNVAGVAYAAVGDVPGDLVVGFATLGLDGVIGISPVEVWSLSGSNISEVQIRSVSDGWVLAWYLSDNSVYSLWAASLDLAGNTRWVEQIDHGPGQVQNFNLEISETLGPVVVFGVRVGDYELHYVGLDPTTGVVTPASDLGLGNPIHVATAPDGTVMIFAVQTESAIVRTRFVEVDPTGLLAGSWLSTISYNPAVLVWDSTEFVAYGGRNSRPGVTRVPPLLPWQPLDTGDPTAISAAAPGFGEAVIWTRSGTERFTRHGLTGMLSFPRLDEGYIPVLPLDLTRPSEQQLLYAFYDFANTRVAVRSVEIPSCP